MKNPTLPGRNPILFVALWMTLAFQAMAIDPLPPELEKAPLAEQAAWREKMGEKAQQEKAQVAQQRFDQRMVLKQSLMDRIEREASERRVAVYNPAPESLPVVQPMGINTKLQMTFILFFSILAIACFSHRFTKPEQQTAKASS